MILDLSSLFLLRNFSLYSNSFLNAVLNNHYIIVTNQFQIALFQFIAISKYFIKSLPISPFYYSVLYYTILFYSILSYFIPFYSMLLKSILILSSDFFLLLSFTRSAENDEDIEGKYQSDSPRSENGLGAGNRDLKFS